MTHLLPSQIDKNIINQLKGYSRFLSRFTLKNPDIEMSLIGTSLDQKKQFHQFQKEISDLVAQPIDPIDHDFFMMEYLKKLKKYKYTEYFRITARDLAGYPQEEILSEISSLSEAIVRALSLQLYHQLCLELGEPVTLLKENCLYSILGFGKLGGKELNYSSDIDLIAFYETDDGSAGDKSLHEFFTTLVQRLTKYLTHHDEDGFLYRVDWELRPEGRAGTLVNSMKAMKNYYETFGAEWERQVYIKSRPIAGSDELGCDFLKHLQPFIYRRTLDTKSLDNILGMRKRIQDEQGKKVCGGYNVKIGQGGIRECEFIIQALQLIFAGNMPTLQTTSSLTALDNLAWLKIISTTDSKILKEAYLFLRKLEHRLQMIDEAQTHFFPDTPEFQKMVSRFFYDEKTDDEETWPRLKKELEHHTTGIKNIFSKIFHSEPAEQSNDTQDLLKKALLPFQEQLEFQLSKFTDLENRLDELRYFKKNYLKKIQTLDQEDSVPRAEVCRQLSLVAESIALKALDFALNECEQKYGRPRHGSGEQALVMLVAMGKLGGREINYHSDLDMIFVYTDDGETDGDKKITNREFFSHVIQRFITYISITTRAGKGYDIDSELRPSGKSGALVISLSAFMTYHREASSLWERQALLKARPMGQNTALVRLFLTQLSPLLFEESLPENAKEVISNLRNRIEIEVAKETTSVLDLKYGQGGILDIEFILQYLQLKMASQIPPLKTGNTFDGLRVLEKEKILSLSHITLLEEAYDFFRSVEAKIQLQINRSQTRWQRSSPVWSEIAASLYLKDGVSVLKVLDDFRTRVRQIFSSQFSN